MKRHLKNKEIRELFSTVVERYGRELVDKKDKVELDEDLILVNEELRFFLYENHPVPVLRMLLTDNFLKQIVVDMGAVRFVASGADIMRPGIKEIPTFGEGDVVSVVDINNRRPLAVGIAMFDSVKMDAMATGKVIRNIHHVGDRIWNRGETG